MTDNPEELRARARRAFEQSTKRRSAVTPEPVDIELLEKMERAMALLPRLTREVFLANRIDDASYTDIARVTGLSERQVERRMAQAIYHLSRFLDGDERTPWRRWWDRQMRRWRR